MNAFQRNYHCKDEELLMAGRMLLTSLETDLPDLTAYSPVFSASYLDAFRATVQAVADLIAPEEETVVRKQISQRLHDTLEGLRIPANHLEGYVTLAKGSLKLSATDFGITKLRQGIQLIDPEKALDGLHIVNNNITRYKPALEEKGLTDALVKTLTDATAALVADRTKQYEILNRRKMLVQDNIQLLVQLYGEITDTMKVGLMLYRKSNPAKAQQYSFRSVLKQVRHFLKEKEKEEAAATAKG